MNTQTAPPPATAPPIDWEAVYAHWLPRVYNYFRYRVNDDALAEDLTAATFVKAWRARADYDPARAALSTWLFAIAGHAAADHFRSVRPALPLEATGSLGDDEAVVEALIEGREDVARLNALLAALPARERELIALKYGAEMTNRAIAAVVGLSESNVGTILHRAIQALRRQWDE